MEPETKFTQLHPDPSGSEPVPATRDFHGMFLVFGGLVEAGRRLGPTGEQAILPDVKIQPYIPETPSQPAQLLESTE